MFYEKHVAVVGRRTIHVNSRFKAPIRVPTPESTGRIALMMQERRQAPEPRGAATRVARLGSDLE